MNPPSKPSPLATSEARDAPVFGRPETLAREAVPFEIDVATVVEVIRRRAAAIAVGAVLGLVAALGILWLVPARFDGRAMILIRTSTFDPASLTRARIGPLSELMPGALGGNSNEELSTEIALLTSRATLGAVVDSLRLQVILRSPRRVPVSTIVDSIRSTQRFRPVKVSIVPGVNRIAGATVWARRPAKIKLLDREDAIDDLQERAYARLIAGDVVEIRYRGRDSVTAAQVPNLLAAVYMLRRATVDRGLNQRRLEFLAAKADSVRLDLRRSADVLAGVAARNGAGANPEIGAKALADEASALETRLAELRATEVALDSLVDAAQTKRIDPRALAGFPDLLRSPALNDLLSQIARVETERTVLLARAAATSPRVIALERARDSLARQMLPIAMSYRASLSRQRESLARDLVGVYGRIRALPAQAAAVEKERAEVTRLAAMNAGMGAQVLEARLAALLEGGDVRVIDAAEMPRKVSFPRPAPTVIVCVLAGILLGLGYALLGLRARRTNLG